MEQHERQWIIRPVQNGPVRSVRLYTRYTKVTGLQARKAYAHSGTFSSQILLLLAHAYMQFA